MRKRLVLDAGHGGSDPGAVYEDWIEKWLTLGLSLQVAGRMVEMDPSIEVRLLRIGDAYLSLEDRYEYANSYDADYFCSLHFNAAGGTGLETYGSLIDLPDTNRKNRLLSQRLGLWAQEHNITYRGHKHQNFDVLEFTKCPAILVEVLFIDSIADMVKWNQAHIRHSFIEWLATGLIYAVR